MLAAIVLVAQTPTLSLVRGGEGDRNFRYHAVSDTYIDNSKATENYGRDPLLSGGPGKTILIKFGDLPRLIGGARVVRARLILHQEIGAEPQLAGVFRLVTPWGEGPGRRGMGLLSVPIEPGAKAPNISATWDSPMGGRRYDRWQAPGARGLADREELKAVSGISSDNQLIVDGLGPAVQQMVENPFSNFGFALDFRNPVDFASSEAAYGRPVLQIETEGRAATAEDLQMMYVSCSRNLAAETPKEGETISWTAHFRYSGGDGSGAVRVRWSVDGQEMISDLPTGLKNGEDGTATVSWLWRTNPSDHRTRKIQVRAEMGRADGNRANNAVEFYEGARPVTMPDDGSQGTYAQAAQFLNDVALPFSRFSFSLDGAKTGIRIQGFSGPGEREPMTLRAAARELLVRAGIPNLERSRVRPSDGADRQSEDPFPGLSGGGDTRDDSAYPNVLGFPAEPWYDAATAQLRFEETDLLAATEVAALQAMMKPGGNLGELTPKTTVLRVLDAAGQLVKGARLEFFARKGGKFGAVPIFAVDDMSGGVGPIPNQGRTPFPDFDDGVLMVRVSRGGASATGFLKAWQLVDSFARGNTDAGIIPLQVPLPPAKPGDKNLAESRILTDSKDSLPTKLEALIDGSAETNFDWPNKAGWIEIDLGKDRAIGKVELTFKDGKIWNAFRISVFGTGQKPDAARLWAQEIDGPWMLANRGANGAISYYGNLVQARYIRIEIPEGAGQASLSEWRVFGLD